MCETMVFALTVSDRHHRFIADKLSEILDELHISQANIIGESFGGIVAQHFALKYPARVHSLSLISSLAKTELNADVEFKINYLLPILRIIGKIAPGIAQELFARIHLSDVVEQHEPEVRFIINHM